MIETERTFWNGFWAEEDNLNLKPHSSLILASEKVLRGFNGKKTLEVGAGRAVDSIEMAKRGANSHIVDFSENSFNLSLTLAKNSGVQITPWQANIETLPFIDNSFDLVFSQGLMEHPGLMESLLSEQIRVTTQGGFILIDTPQLFSIQAMIKLIELKLDKWPFGPELNFTEKELQRIVGEAGLEYITSYGRGIIPRVNFGIRRVFSKIQQGEVSSKCLPIKKSLMQALELSRVGPKVLNNVGVIARKPEF